VEIHRKLLSLTPLTPKLAKVESVIVHQTNLFFLFLFVFIGFFSGRVAVSTHIAFGQKSEHFVQKSEACGLFCQT
jgi:hypothetical protein